MSLGVELPRWLTEHVQPGARRQTPGGSGTLPEYNFLKTAIRSGDQELPTRKFVHEGGTEGKGGGRMGHLCRTRETSQSTYLLKT